MGFIKGIPYEVGVAQYKETARGQLLALQSELWSLIREQAVEAEREVQHA